MNYDQQNNNYGRLLGPTKSGINHINLKGIIRCKIQSRRQFR